MEKVEYEKRAADHLFYVSLKYTKTCDVILSLIARWNAMIEAAIDLLLEKIKKKKLITAIPLAPKLKISLLNEVFRREKIVRDILQLYIFFRKIPELRSEKSNEYKKNFALIVYDEGKEIVINIEKLQEWQELLEKFINFVSSYVK